MKTFNSFLKLAIFSILFATEFLILKLGSQTTIIVISSCFILFDLSLLFTLYHLNRLDMFKVLIAKILRNIASKFMGIFALLYFILNLTWLSNSLFFMNDPDRDFNVEILLYIAFIFTPFLLISLLIRREEDNLKNDDRKILFTSLSLLDGRRVENSELTSIEEKKLSVIQNNHYNDWDTDKELIQWQPLFKTIASFKNIEEIVVFLTFKTMDLNNAIKRNEEFKSCNIESLLNKYFKNITFHFPVLSEPNILQTTINEMNMIVRNKMKTYDDQDMVFSVTSGTSIVSGAMTVISILGKRGIIYMHQDSKELVTDTIDVFTVKELWAEIADKYE